MAAFEPGECVVKRVPWQPNANVLGFVIASYIDGLEWCTVMWMLGDNRVEFKTHVADALLAVCDANVGEIAGRCTVKR